MRILNPSAKKKELNPFSVLQVNAQTFSSKYLIRAHFHMKFPTPLAYILLKYPVLSSYPLLSQPYLSDSANDSLTVSCAPLTEVFFEI